MFSDAIRGQDSPSWRLCPGLILTRFLPDKFVIFSIPHLMFTDFNGEMIRVEKGSAIRRYQSVLPNVKLTFPNQVNVRTQSNAKGKDSRTFDDATNGVRAQMDRAERMFVDLLARLDQTDTIDLPTTKADWMLFLDIGIEVLELYATLAYGFAKGGGKISQAHATAIMQGKFDP
jgi:hypothetical protein